jgi:large subunit ribosomal protein L31
MKDDIHPRYVNCTVTCGCGNSFQTRATVPELRVEVCSVCHPFYSGKQRFVDSARRVDKFIKRYAKTESAKK